MPVACPAVLAAIGGAVSCERLKEPWPIDQFGCGFEIQPAQLTKRRAGRPEVQSCISLIPLGARPLVAARRRRARRENTWSCARWPMRPAPAKARSPAAPLDNSPMSAGWLDVVWRCKNLKREPLSSGVFSWARGGRPAVQSQDDLDRKGSMPWEPNQPDRFPGERRGVPGNGEEASEPPRTPFF